MANGKANKTLRKVVEGEHLAANALAVAIGKVKETDLKQLLGQIRDTHEGNIEEAGQKLQLVGGKYPIPGLRDQLNKGWQSIASSKTSIDAVKLLQKKEREALLDYKSLLKQASDEGTMSLILRNMAATTENIVKLSEGLGKLQSKQKKGRLLGIPLLIWLLAIGGGAGYFWYKQTQTEPVSPTPPTSDGSSNS